MHLPSTTLRAIGCTITQCHTNYQLSTAENTCTAFPGQTPRRLALNMTNTTNNDSNTNTTTTSATHTNTTTTTTSYNNNNNNNNNNTPSVLEKKEESQTREVVRHMTPNRPHTIDRQQCDVFGKWLAYQATLRTHVRNAHSGVSDRSYYRRTPQQEREATQSNRKTLPTLWRGR